MGKNVNIFILCFLLLASCNAQKDEGKREIKKNKLNEYSYSIVHNHFKDNMSVKSESVINSLNKFFLDKPFLIVKIFTIKNYKKTLYFAVNKYMQDKVFNAFTQAIIVDEDGKIIETMDTNRGLYQEEIEVLSLKKLGLNIGDVRCFVINFSGDNENMFELFILDQNLNNMSNIRNENPAFEALTLGQIDESIEYGPLNMDSPIVSKEKNYKDMKKRIDTYRQYKEKGIVYKSPAVKEEYERLKKKAEAELN